MQDKVLGMLLPKVSMPDYNNGSKQRTKAAAVRFAKNNITYEELSQYFHLPQKKACQQLDIGLTHMKRICRAFGLPRWPYMKKVNTETEPAGAGAPQNHKAAVSQQEHLEETHPIKEVITRPMPCRADPAHGNLNAATLHALGLSGSADLQTGTPSAQDATNSESERAEITANESLPDGSDGEANDSANDRDAVVCVEGDQEGDQQQQQQRVPAASSLQQHDMPLMPAEPAITAHTQLYLAILLSCLSGDCDDGEKAVAVGNLVRLLASQPALAAQLIVNLMKDHRSRIEAAAQPRVLVSPFDQVLQSVPNPAHEPRVQQTLSQPAGAYVAQALPLADGREMNPHVQQQHLQRAHSQFVPNNNNAVGGDPHASTSANLFTVMSGDRRADLIAKLQESQSKMALRQASLQRISAFVSTYNPQQTEVNNAGPAPPQMHIQPSDQSSHEAFHQHLQSLWSGRSVP